MPKRICAEGLFLEQSCHQRRLQRTEGGRGGESLQGLEVSVHLVPLSAQPGTSLLYKHFSSHLRVNCLPPD